MQGWRRRDFLIQSGAFMAGMVASRGWAQGSQLKVAGIYTVPIEQQWVSRIHKALMAATQRGDIE
ncbi:MAG: hypothetical protein Q6L60_15695, partial [Thermostichus sp. HHBFW_bins_43]